MLSLCMKLLETDNEENAVICLRIIFDLHKNFRPTLECEVQPFLDFVQRIYQGRRRNHAHPSRAACRRSLPRAPHHQLSPSRPTPPCRPTLRRAATRPCPAPPLTTPSPRPPALARPAHDR